MDGLYSTLYEPSSLSTTLAFTLEEPRIATMNTSPPACCLTPSASRASMVKEADWRAIARCNPSPDTTHIRATVMRRTCGLSPRCEAGATAGAFRSLVAAAILAAIALFAIALFGWLAEQATSTNRANPVFGRRAAIQRGESGAS